MNIFNVFSWFFSEIYGKLFTISIIIIAVLPTGNIYGFNLKIVAVLILLFFFLCRLRLGVIGARVFFLSLSPILFFIVYFLLGLSNGYSQSAILDHLVGFLSVVALCVLLEPERGRLESGGYFVDAVILSTLIFSLLKSLSWMFVLIGFWEIKDLFDFVVNVFSYEFITLETDIGSRLHFPIDYILPIGLKFYFMKYGCNTKIKKIFGIFLMALVALAIVVAYSRLLYGYAVITTIIFYRMNIYRLASVFLIISLLLYLLSGGIDYFQLVIDFLYERFFGVHAKDSDSVRLTMFDELYRLFANSPLIGSGLGSHPEFIRFEEAPWNYELQTMSMIAQFGVVGFLLIIIYFSYYLEVSKNIIFAFPAVMMFLIWMGVNSINCFFLTSQGGCILVSIRYLGIFLREKNET